MLFNKSQFKVANNKKLLRKIGKKWVTVSALTLVLLGGGALISSATTHADTTIPAVEAKETNNVKKQINNNLDKAYQMKNNAQSGKGDSVLSASSSVNSSSVSKPSNIQSKATNMYRGLMMNAVHTSNNSSSSSTSSKSSVASSGSVSASAKPSFNSAYQSYMAKMSGTDNEVASANDKNAQSNNTNIKRPLLKNNAQPDYFSGNVTKTGTDDGLNYKVYQNGGVEFTNGIAQSDLSNFSYDVEMNNIYNADIVNAKAIKFDNTVDTSHVTNMECMFFRNSNLQSLTLPDSFDTSKVTDMVSMFNSDYALQSLTLPSSFNTSKVTNMNSMFDDDDSLRSLTLPDSFDTSKVTNMFDMFNADEALQSLTLPNSFDTSKVTIMTSMFSDDRSLQSLILPNSFDTSKVTTMDSMFEKDYALQSLTLPSSFNTSRVSDMNHMFCWDNNLQSLVLPSSFDTSKVSDMISMFGSDESLQSLTIQSPDTKINSSSALPLMYKTNGVKDFTGRPYTTSEPNDFSDGNMGTFLSPAHIPTDTINYQYDGATKGSQQFKASPSDYVAGKYIVNNSYKDLDVNSSNAKLPNGYHLVNNDNNVKFDNGTYNIAIMPNTMATTVEYQYNGSNVSKQTFMANLSDYNMNVNKYNDIDITSSDNIPNGYHLVRANNKVPFDNGTHGVEIAPTVVTVDYQYDGATKGSQQFKATDNDYSSLNVTKANAELPNGYHLVNNDNNVKFDNGTYDVKITPNTMTTTVDYQYNGATKGSQMFTANLSDYNVNVNCYNDMDITSSDSIPKWYHLVNADNRVPFDNGTHDVAIVPNSVNVQYHDIYGDSDGLTPPANTAQQVSSDGTYTVTAPQGWALVSSDGFTRAPSASGYVSKNVTVDVAPYTNGLTFDYDKNDNTLEFVHRVPSEDDNPYHLSDIKNVGSITFGSDAYMNNKAVNIDSVFAQDNNLRKVTIKSNKTKVSVMEPFYDRVFDNDSSFSLRPSVMQINGWYQRTLLRRTQPQYHLDKRYEFKGANKVAKIYATTPSSKPINPLKKINEKDNVSVSIPLVYNQALHGRLVTKPRQLKAPSTAKLLGEAFVQYPSHDVRVYYLISNKSTTLCIQHDLGKQSSSSSSPFPSLYKEMANGDTAPEPNDFSKGNVGTFVRHATVNYVSNKDGKSVGSCSITGDSSSIQGANDTLVDITPMTAQNLPKGYHLVNTNNQVPFDGQAHNVMVSGDMVVGTAYLTLLYQKNNRTDGRVLKLHINGNIGDSDIVINPQDYDKPGYKVSTTKDWHISFKYSDVTKFTHDFSRYNRENTFVYQANPINIDIKYIDTQTNKSVNKSDTVLSDVAYDGDTADLQGTDDDNNILSVDGHEYHLNLPAGYHLAHANNYIKVTDNGTYTKQVPNGVGGFRTVRMPLMKLTLGITPHFHKHNTKPARTSSVTPVKPSSASSVTPSSTSSVQSSSAKSVQPSSASSMTPSSTSQLVVPSSTASVTPIVLPSSEASSTSQPSSVAPASKAEKPSSASTSPASNVATKPVIKPTVHTTNHSEARLNHSISKATKQLSTVERHMKARKATEAKAIHKLVHAKKTIKRSQHKITYLRHNKRHVAHALRRITRNKVAIKHAKKVIRTVKAHQAKRVTKFKVTKPVAKSIKNSVNAPKAHSTNQPTVTKKLPQTGEDSHAGLMALILMIASAILADFGKLFDRKRTE